MRAALYDRLGPADVLRVDELPTPDPGPGEVRVRVRVSGVNPTDWKTRSAGPGKEMPFPFVVPNQDGAGEIDAVGPGVDPALIGQRVWIWFAARGRQYGTAAQWVCLPQDQAVPLPERASFDLGASLGIPALTAHWALFADGSVEGRTVLVAGGAGAVGHFAIELARWGGARVVTTVSSEEKAALARAAGADAVVNYRVPNAADQIRAAAPHGVHRIVEVDLAANLDLDLGVLVSGGVIMTYADSGTAPTLPVRRLMTGNVTLRFMMIYSVPAGGLRVAVEEVTSIVASGELSELPATRFGLDQIADAHRAVEDGAVGKVLIDIP